MNMSLRDGFHIIRFWHLKKPKTGILKVCNRWQSFLGKTKPKKKAKQSGKHEWNNWRRLAKKSGAKITK